MIVLLYVFGLAGNCFQTTHYFFKGQAQFKSLSILHFKRSLHMLRVKEKVLPFFVENGLFFTACRRSLNVNHVTKSRDLLTE